MDGMYNIETKHQTHTHTKEKTRNRFAVCGGELDEKRKRRRKKKRERRTSMGERTAH